MEDEVVALVPTSLIDAEQASLRRQFFQKLLPAIVTPEPPVSPLEKRETEGWNGNVEIQRPKSGREPLEEIKRPGARHHRNTRRVALPTRGRPVTPNSTWARPPKGRSRGSSRTSGAQTRQLDVEEVKHAKGGSYQHRATDTRRPVSFHGPGRQNSHTIPYPWPSGPSESGRFKPTQALPENLRENNSSTASPVCRRSTEGSAGKHEATADREDADSRESSSMQNDNLPALEKQASNSLAAGNNINSSQPRPGMSVLDLREDRLETATQNQLEPAAVESTQNRFILHSGGERVSATPETRIENQSTSSVLPPHLPASLVATVNSLAEDIRNLKATQQQDLARKTEHEMKLEEDMRSLEKHLLYAHPLTSAAATAAANTTSVLLEKYLFGASGSSLPNRRSLASRTVLNRWLTDSITEPNNSAETQAIMSEAEKQLAGAVAASSSTVKELNYEMQKIRRDFEALTEHLIHRENVATLAAELGLSPSSPSFQPEIAGTKPALADSPQEACVLRYPDKNIANLETSTNAVSGSPHLAAQRSSDFGRPLSHASRRLSPSRHPDFPASKAPRPDKDADRRLGSVIHLPRRVELRIVPQKVHRKTNRAVESRGDRDDGRPLVVKDSSSFKNVYAPPQARTILQDLNSVLTCLTAVNVFDPAASCSTGHASPEALPGLSEPSRHDAPVLFRPISETKNLPISGANVREENRLKCQSALPGFASSARNSGNRQNPESDLNASLPQRPTTVRGGTSSFSIRARLTNTAGEAPSRIPRPSAKTAIIRRASLTTQRERSPPGQNKSRIPVASQVVSSQDLLVSPSLVHRGENEVCQTERLLAFSPLQSDDGGFPRETPLGHCPLLVASLVPHKAPPVFLEASTRVKPSYLSCLSPGNLGLPCPHQAEAAYTAERHNVSQTRQKALDESLSWVRKPAPESLHGRVSTSTGRCPWHGTGKQRLLEEKSLTSQSPTSSILRRASRPAGRSLERVSGSQRVGSGSPVGTIRRQRACTVVFSDCDSRPFQATPRNRASSAGSLRSSYHKQWQARAGGAGHGPGNPLRSSNCVDTAPLTSANPRNERSGCCTRSGTNRKCRRCEACDPSRLATPGTPMSVKRVRGPVIGPPLKDEKPCGIAPSSALPGTIHRPNAECLRVTACARQLQQGTSPLKVLRVERGVSPVASGLPDETTPTARHLCDADDNSLTELPDDSDTSTTSLSLSSASSTPLSSFVSSTTSLDSSRRWTSHDHCAGSLSSNCPHLRKRRMCGTSRCFRARVSRRLHSGGCLERRGESERQFNRLMLGTADFWQGGWESRALWAGAPGHPGCLPWGSHCAGGERLWTPWKSLVVRHEMAVQTRTEEREVHAADSVAPPSRGNSSSRVSGARELPSPIATESIREALGLWLQTQVLPSGGEAGAWSCPHHLTEEHEQRQKLLSNEKQVDTKNECEAESSHGQKDCLETTSLPERDCELIDAPGNEPDVLYVHCLPGGDVEQAVCNNTIPGDRVQGEGLESRESRSLDPLDGVAQPRTDDRALSPDPEKRSEALGAGGVPEGPAKDSTHFVVPVDVTKQSGDVPREESICQVEAIAILASPEVGGDPQPSLNPQLPVHVVSGHRGDFGAPADAVRPPYASATLSCSQGVPASPHHTHSIERSCSPMNTLPPFRKERAISPVQFSPMHTARQRGFAECTADYQVHLRRRSRNSEGGQREVKSETSRRQPSESLNSTRGQRVSRISPLESLSRKFPSDDEAFSESGEPCSLFCASVQLQEAGTSPLVARRETPPFRRNASPEQLLTGSTQFMDLRYLRSSVSVQVVAEMDLNSESSLGCQRQAVDRSVGPTTSGSISSPRSIQTSLEVVHIRSSSRDGETSASLSGKGIPCNVDDRRTFETPGSPATPSISHSRVGGNIPISPVLRTERGASPINIPSLETCKKQKPSTRVGKTWRLSESCQTERSSVSEGSLGSVSSGEVFEDRIHRGRILACFSHSMETNGSQNVSGPVRGYTETAFRPNPPTNSEFNGWAGHQMSSQVEWGPSGSRSTTDLAGGLFPTGRFRKKNKPEATEDELQSDNHVQQRENVVTGTRNRFGGSFSGGGQVLLLLSDGRLTPAKDAETLSGLLSPGEVIVGKRPPEGKPEWLQVFGRPDHPEKALSQREGTVPSSSPSSCSFSPGVVSSPELETPDSYESPSSGEVPPSLEQPPLPASPVIHGHNMAVNQRLSPDGSPLSSNAQSRCSMTPLTLPATNVGTRPISSTLNSPRSPVDFTGCYGKSLTFSDSAADKFSRVSDIIPAAQKPVLASSFIEKNARERMATPPPTAPASCAEASFANTPPTVDPVRHKTSPKERKTRKLEYSQLKQGAANAEFTDSYLLGSSQSKHSDQCSASPCASVTHSPPRGSAVSSPKGASKGAEAAAFLPSRRRETSLTCLTRPSALKELHGAGTENPLDSPRGGGPDRATAVHCAVSAISAIATTSLSPCHRFPSLPDSPQQVPLPFLLSPTTAEADASYPGEEFPASAPNLLECSDITFGTPVPGWH